MAAWEQVKDSLVYDGRPETCYLTNKQQVKLCCYRWGSENRNPKGVIVIQHGVRAHLRLTWLTKRPDDIESSRKFLLPRQHVNRARKVSNSGYDAEDVCCAKCTDLWAKDGSCEMSDLSTVSSASTTPCHSRDKTADSGMSTSGTMSPSTDLGSSCRPAAGHEFPEDPAVRDVEVLYNGSWIEGFVEDGFLVYGMDLQGHGLSDHLVRRGDVSDIDDFRDDLLLFLQEVVLKDTERSKSIPLILMAVSLSGLVTMRLLQKMEEENMTPPNLSGILLLAPFLKKDRRMVEKWYGRAGCRLLKLGGKIVPSKTLALPVKPETSGPDWQIRYGEHDPYLIKTPFTYNMIAKSIEGLEKYEQGLASLRRLFARGVNLLVIHNINDHVNPYYATVDTYKDLGGVGNFVLLNYTSPGSNSEIDDLQQHSDAVVLDKESLALDHTILSDPDNSYVFNTYVHKWLHTV